MIIRSKGTTIDIKVEIPENLDKMLEKYGELLVTQFAEATLMRHYQTRARRLLDQGLSAKEVQEDLDNYRPKPYIRKWMRNRS